MATGPVLCLMNVLGTTGESQCSRSVPHCRTIIWTFRCFELLGIDVMITEGLKPILMEVNHSPNLTTGSPLDERIKHGAVSDCLRMLGIRSNEAVGALCFATVFVLALRSVTRPTRTLHGHTGNREKGTAGGCEKTSTGADQEERPGVCIAASQRLTTPCFLFQNQSTVLFA